MFRVFFSVAIKERPVYSAARSAREPGNREANARVREGIGAKTNSPANSRVLGPKSETRNENREQKSYKHGTRSCSSRNSQTEKKAREDGRGQGSKNNMDHDDG